MIPIQIHNSKARCTIGLSGATRLLCLTALVSLPVVSAVPFQFQEGTTASAQDVNANFEALSLALDELSGRATNATVDCLSDPNALESAIAGGSRIITVASGSCFFSNFNQFGVLDISGALDQDGNRVAALQIPSGFEVEAGRVLSLRSLNVKRVSN
jgi:hypothetical protein